MFRKLCHPSNNLKHFSNRLCSTVFEPKLNTPPALADNGIHSIRVTGRVMNVFHQKNDQITFYMKAVVEKAVHKIIVSNRSAAILDVAKRLKPEHNVSVEGKLSTARIQTDEGKHRSVSAIVATELCIVADAAVASDANESRTRLYHSNCVELLGAISTEVTGTNFKTFTLSTIKDPRRDRDNPKNLTHNRIFVYDKTLFPLLDELNINQAMFLVRGMICYRIETDQFGKVATTAYILAKQLYRA